jgi:hypothetical protein
MNARSVFLIVLVVAFVLPLMVTAQEKEVSITGCLNKGTAADQYVIKDDKSGRETTITGDAKLLAPHANNHQVTVTGTMAKEKDKEVLKATNLKMIAVCK